MYAGDLNYFNLHKIIIVVIILKDMFAWISIWSCIIYFVNHMLIECSMVEYPCIMCMCIEGSMVSIPYTCLQERAFIHVFMRWDSSLYVVYFCAPAFWQAAGRSFSFARVFVVSRVSLSILSSRCLFFWYFSVLYQVCLIELNFITMKIYKGWKR